jgi:hypothetical protein
VTSSSSFPVLGLLGPVTGLTKLNPSIFSKVFQNLFSFLVGILESFLGSCPVLMTEENYAITGTETEN